MEYILNDALCVYKTDDNTILIVNGIRGEKINFEFNESIVKLLSFLQSPRSQEEILSNFEMFSEESVIQVLHTFERYEVIKRYSRDKEDIRVMLIGAGSIGSHIFKHLIMLHNSSICVVDSDFVDETNINRQYFEKSDVGKKKIDVLTSMEGIVPEKHGIDMCVASSDDIITLAKKYSSNLLIQAGDFPSSGMVSSYVAQAGLELGIPYIINPGYIGGCVVFPEFYFPDKTYSYFTVHKSWNARLLFQHQNEKIPFRICSELGSIVAQQVEDYSNKKLPVGYMQRGHFDSVKYEWNTVPVDKQGNEVSHDS